MFRLPFREHQAIGFWDRVVVVPPEIFVLVRLQSVVYLPCRFARLKNHAVRPL
jgi:hypothetical protein